MTKKIAIALLSVIMIAVLLIKGKSLLEERQEEIKKLPTPSALKLSISVVKGKEGVLEQKLSTAAEVASDESPALSTKIPGYVERVMTKEAKKVKKDELLVQIDSFELRSSMKALQKTLLAQKSDYELAKSIYERNKKLAKVGGISKEKLAASRVAMEMKASAVDSTKEKISQLEHQLSYLEIKAPFDGVIERIILHKGDLAAIGKPILTMNNGKHKLIFSYTPAKDLSVKRGQKVLYNGEVIGRVDTIYPVARNGLHSAEVVLDKELSLPVGSFITIEVVIRQAKGCILPDTTIVHKKDGDYIMLYVDGKFIPKRVVILVRTKNRILISECPKSPVASGSESKLAILPAYKNVVVLGVDDEQ